MSLSFRVAQTRSKRRSTWWPPTAPHFNRRHGDCSRNRLSPRAGAFVLNTLIVKAMGSGQRPNHPTSPPGERQGTLFCASVGCGQSQVGQGLSVHCDGCASVVPAKITFLSPQVEYTPPVIYSNESRDKLVLMVIAKPSAEDAPHLHPGQPVEVELQ